MFQLKYVFFFFLQVSPLRTGKNRNRCELSRTELNGADDDFLGFVLCLLMLPATPRNISCCRLNPLNDVERFTYSGLSNFERKLVFVIIYLRMDMEQTFWPRIVINYMMLLNLEIDFSDILFTVVDAPGDRHSPFNKLAGAASVVSSIWNTCKIHSEDAVCPHITFQSSQTNDY